MTRSAQRYTAGLSSLLLAASFATAGQIGTPWQSRSASAPHLVMASASPIVLM